MNCAVMNILVFNSCSHYHSQLYSRQEEVGRRREKTLGWDWHICLYLIGQFSQVATPTCIEYWEMKFLI